MSDKPVGPGAPGEPVGHGPDTLLGRRPRDLELKDPGYELFVGALSLLSLVNLVLLYVVRDEALDTVLLVMNGLISAILLIDFIYRLFSATSKVDYVLRQYGWADLLSALPLQQVKVFRLFRLVRIGLLLRENGYRNLRGSLLRNRAGSALLSLLLLGILVLEFGSLWVLALEEGVPGAEITSASDAIWYVLVTISTVGYGDEFPVSTGGRLLGSVVIIIGVGIFGTFTGYLANRFLAPKPPLMEEGDSTRERVEQLRVLMAQQQAAIEELDLLLRQRQRSRDPEE